MKKLAAIFTTIVIALAVTAGSSAATTPPPPPQPPAAYAQTTFYDACTDWFLQSPGSVSDPKWVFYCSHGSPDSGVGEDWWYWNADLQAAIWYQTDVWDSGGWYWYCFAYPYGLDAGGACNA